jgi:oligoendopeptidase F
LEDYLRLCREGGSKSFLELVKVADLISPFQEEGVKSFVSAVDNWLDKFKDGTLN